VSIPGFAEPAIWSVDREPIVRVITMDRLMEISEAQRRFILILFETFGIVALLLAAVGLYGVLSGGVVERVHEIGIRMALGATRRGILVLALRDGMRLTAFGLGIGLCRSGCKSGNRLVALRDIGARPSLMVQHVGTADGRSRFGLLGSCMARHKSGSL